MTETNETPPWCDDGDDLEQKTKLRVLQTEKVTEDGKTYLRAYGRDEDNEPDSVIITGYTPRFYAKDDEVEAMESLTYESRVKRTNDGYTSLSGEDVTSVEVQPADAVKDLRDLFNKTYEADVWHKNRVRIDLGIKTGIKYPTGEDYVHYTEIETCEFTEPDHRIVTLDIEVDDRGGMEAPEDAGRRIVSIVAHDSYTDKVVGFFNAGGRSLEECFSEEMLEEGNPPGEIDSLQCGKDERRMLIRFGCWIQDTNPDVLTGWNFTAYDMPYIINRMKKTGASVNRLARNGSAYTKESWGELTGVVDGRMVYDLLEAYKTTKFSELPSYSLDNVAEEEIGDVKIDLDGDGYGIWDAYQNDPAKLLRYNAKDTMLTWQVNVEGNVIPFKERIATNPLIGCELGQTNNSSDIIEFSMRRRLKEWGVVGPTKNPPNNAEEYEGAHVVDAYTGVAENVCGIDLASLYPNNLSMFNMSPETKVDPAMADMTDTPYYDVPGVNVGFKKNEEGLVSGLVDDLLDMKNDLKQRLKDMDSSLPEYDALEEEYNVTKVIVNSLYGVIGWERFFLYDEDVAEACAAGAGQHCIKLTQRYIDNETPGTVIYGDTDSNYVSFPSDWSAEKCVEYAEEMSETLNEEIYPEAAEKFGVEDCRWEIEPEMYAIRFLQVGQKKNYAYLVKVDDGTWLDKPKVKIKGFQAIKSNYSKLTRSTQRKVIEGILHDIPNEELAQGIQESAAKISQDPDWDEIAIPQGLGQELKDYPWSDGTPKREHPRAAYFANQYLGKDYGKGNKPKRVKLNPRRSMERIDAIAFEKVSDLDGHKDDLHIDVEAMQNKIINKPNAKLLDQVGVDIDAALRGQVQSSFGAFV